MTAAAGTSFTYQGELRRDGAPVTASCDFQFSLFDALTGGTQHGSPQTVSGVGVANGRFTVTLNAGGEFGGSAFDGNARWLAVAVKCPPEASFTPLSPRQPLTPAPYAQYAAGAPWAGLSGVPAGFADNIDDNTTYTAGLGLALSGGVFGVVSSTVQSRVSGACAPGSSISAINADGTVGCELDDDTTYTNGLGLALTGTAFSVVSSTVQLRVASSCAPGSSIRAIDTAGAVTCEIDDTGGGDNYWGLFGNAGTTPAYFAGTTDNMTFTLAVSGTTGLRLGPTTGTPNLLGGYVGNTVANGVTGAVIGGGGIAGLVNSVSADYGSIGGGGGNTASGGSATVGGGGGNTASGSTATVGGGGSNTASGGSATVGGGGNNTATSSFVTVGGGSSNTASGPSATIGGGGGNNASSNDATVGGGGGNNASGSATTIAGGSGNAASGSSATVGGGSANTASGSTATVAGGSANMASFPNATVGGGGGNAARSDNATVAGGTGNTASGSAATVAGGNGNTASANEAAVGGGTNNLANSYGTVVAGGTNNTASDTTAAVGGGDHNQASAVMATVSGGQTNTASGLWATVPGGLGNTASGNYSFAAGFNARAINPGAFVWADSTGAVISSTAADQFIVRASGGITLYTNAAASAGAVLYAGSGSWNMLSDRNAKTNIEPVNSVAILEALMQVPIATWSYRTQAVGIHHLGPMAQDFHAAFGLGEAETTISSVDADGVALAAIQGMYTVVQTQSGEITTLRATVAGQQAQIDALTAAQTGANARLAALEAGAPSSQLPVQPLAPMALWGWLLLAGLALLNVGGLAGYVLAKRYEKQA